MSAQVIPIRPETQANDLDCMECGKHYGWGMKAGLCAFCTHWKLLASVGLADNQFIIQGDLYHIDPMPAVWTRHESALGHAGREFCIQRGVDVIVTNNLWFDGSVPNHLRDVLPDNAVFLKEGK